MMNIRHRIAIVSITALLAATFAAAAWAQDPEPPVVEDEAVKGLLMTDPKTPSELIRVAALLADMERADLAKEMLAKVIGAGLSEDDLRGLADEFGTATFINLSSNKSLLPEGGKLADAVLGAVEKKIMDPKRLDALIVKIQDPSVDVRSEALAELSKARGAAIGRIISVLADPTREDEHKMLWKAMTALGPQVVDPLLGVLERSDPRLMTQAAKCLGEIGDKRAIVYLLGPYTSSKSDRKLRDACRMALIKMTGSLPSKQLAVRLLTERASDYMSGRRPLKADENDQVEIWSWDEAAKVCRSQKYASDVAERIVAARLARDAYALAPEDPRVKLLYLTSMLEAESYETGLNDPLQEGEDSVLGRVTEFGVPVVEETLEYAIAGNHLGAAAEAARLLGRIGTAEEILLQGPQPAPLVVAVKHPDRRVRAAALESVVRLQPERSFPGSSYVPESLAFFAGTRGGARALIAGPGAVRMRSFATVLAAAECDADAAVTGKDVIRMATSSPDYEVAFIDVAIDNPPIEEVLKKLRSDYRSADLRVGLIARDGYLEKAERLAELDPLTLAFSRPHTDKDFQWQLDHLLALKPREFASRQLRASQAERALEQLAVLAESSAKLYDLSQIQPVVISAAFVPELTEKAVAVLKYTNSPKAQKALLDVINDWSRPIDDRKAAIKAFRHNTKTNGILLTTGEITAQYDTYNASGDRDLETQHILGQVLDCLEAPTDVVGKKKE